MEVDQVPDHAKYFTRYLLSADSKVFCSVVPTAAGLVVRCGSSIVRVPSNMLPEFERLSRARPLLDCMPRHARKLVRAPELNVCPTERSARDSKRSGEQWWILPGGWQDVPAEIGTSIQRRRPVQE